MVTQTLFSPVTLFDEDRADHLWDEYQMQAALFRAQPARVQHTLELQAQLASKAIVDHISPLLFTLPDQVICEVDGRGEWVTLAISQDLREQKVGGLMELLNVSDLSRHLRDLEASAEPAISTSGRLIRHTIAMHMVHRILPTAQREVGQAPLSAYTLGYFMPQWVALDEHDNLLVNSVQEAEVHIASMQHFLAILDWAASLAPYIVVDQEYQREREGMLGQLVNQGQALARYRTGEIIRIIRRRATAGQLNRGLRLELPYFDDQRLEMQFHDFQVIPAGRIMFVPAFVVLASHLEQMKVAHDPGLSPSTRQHLLAELKTLEEAFDS